MQEIFRHLKFRPYSYEEDPEAVADMHCSAEVLEGYWFDRAETGKVHSKIIVRCPGSSWVLAYDNVIFAHVDLVKYEDGIMGAICWRLHENYQHPEVARALLDGIKLQASQRGAKGVIIFGDHNSIDDNLSMLGIKPDRTYRYIKVSDAAGEKTPRNERIVLNPDDIAKLELYPFLGAPYPPAYILNMAYVAADYALFRHTKPICVEIKHSGKVFFGCYDGREWFVFKKGNFPAEKEDIGPVMSALSKQMDGLILVSEKALGLTEAEPVNDRVYNDYYVQL